MTAPFVAEIARKLTEAQRHWLLTMPATVAESMRSGREKGERWSGCPGWSLINAGLINFSGRGRGGRQIHGYTPLGLAVRAHLLANQGEGGA